ncbi:Cation transport regulator-like protein [Termitomyces sp. J132]|nr:Cation transport regulator-like protein [Termitomyces sp. J132]
MSEVAAPFIVFGYGSLIFKPPPHTIAQIPGFLKGYVRRFAQKSHDHRGTPENPGRVVTLVHKEDWDKFSKSDPFPDDDVVWGIAYTIDPVYEAEVRDYLDYREKDGYTMETLDIYGMNGNEETIIIHKVCLLSDYLYNLVQAIRELSPNSHDSHLYALEVSVSIRL